jgi:hypothetical protein
MVKIATAGGSGSRCVAYQRVRSPRVFLILSVNVAQEIIDVLLETKKH